MTESILTTRRAAQRTLHACLILTVMLISSASHALKSDRNQPALINADEIEIDFKTGDRVYIGNVTIVQGSIRLNADKLIAKFDGSKLKEATAFGSPAVFKQRPDDADGDIVGRGNKMVIDEVKQLITLSENASLTQAGGATIASDNIIYDMKTEKLKAKGGTTTKKPPEKSSNAAPATQSAADKVAQAEASAKQSGADTGNQSGAANTAQQPSITSDSGRMRVVIPPRKKNEN